MASVETNDRKRDEMAAAIRRLEGLGWRPHQLATLMGVSVGTVHTWRRGDSMGTNAQRAHLRGLGTPSAEVSHIVQLAESLEHEANLSERLYGRDLAADAVHVAKFRRTRIDRIRARVKALRELFR